MNLSEYIILNPRSAKHISALRFNDLAELHSKCLLANINNELEGNMELMELEYIQIRLNYLNKNIFAPQLNCLMKYFNHCKRNSDSEEFKIEMKSENIPDSIQSLVCSLAKENKCNHTYLERLLELNDIFVIPHSIGTLINPIRFDIRTKFDTIIKNCASEFQDDANIVCLDHSRSLIETSTQSTITLTQSFRGLSNKNKISEPIEKELLEECPAYFTTVEISDEVSNEAKEFIKKELLESYKNYDVTLDGDDLIIESNNDTLFYYCKNMDWNF